MERLRDDERRAVDDSSRRMGALLQAMAAKLRSNSSKLSLALDSFWFCVGQGGMKHQLGIDNYYAMRCSLPRPNWSRPISRQFTEVIDASQ